MPEGPSIVLAKEVLTPRIKNKIIQKATGNAKIEMPLLQKKKVTEIKSWGKHLLICLPACTIKIHFLMFGSYSIDEQIRPDSRVRLRLEFAKHKVYFYTCSVRLLTTPLDELYDWESDVMNDSWNARKARHKLKDIPDDLVCDALLNQDIFAGVGNIIKNEVLYRIRLHPETQIKNIPSKKLSELVLEARNYSFDFLEWKREFTLKKHWLAHTKKTCLRCNLPLIKKYCGKTHRRTFFCSNCQIKYST
ncbi:MAG: endonuclease [Bacteroidetes bacterium]|nr:MAG: endonuclease [Bacteroidota bacterium]